MKKILSLLMSFVMIISLTASMDFSACAANSTKKNAPEIKLGETVRLTVEQKADGETSDLKSYARKFLKFVPSETAMYEFAISNSAKLAEGYYIEGCIINENGSSIKNGDPTSWESAYYGYAYDGYKNGASALSEINEHSNNLPGSNYSVAAELQANRAYYFVLDEIWEAKNDKLNKSYFADITVKKGHTCTFQKNVIEPAYYNDDFSGEQDGAIFDYCITCGKIVLIKYIDYASELKYKETYIYDGKIHKPKVIVYDTKGKVVPASNYDVKYYPTPQYDEKTDFTKVGCYYVYASFDKSRLYSGRLNGIYEIVPKSTNITKVTVKSTGFTVKWKKQSKETDGYQIQYSTVSNYAPENTKTVKVKNPKTLSKTIKNLKANQKYYVRVRTYKYIYYTENIEEEYGLESHNLYSLWSGSVAIITKPKATSIKSVNAKKKGFTVNWKKQSSGTNGYQIKYSTSSDFKNAKYITVKGTKTTSKTVSKLKANKKYYIKVRTYKTVTAKNKTTKRYSDWSTAKSITTKR